MAFLLLYNKSFSDMLTEGMTIGIGQYKLVHVINNSGYSSERWCAIDLAKQDPVEVCVYPENMKGSLLECFSSCNRIGIQQIL